MVPLLEQEGKTRAIVFDRERRGGRSQRIDQKAFRRVFCERPPRPLLSVADTPPVPGGEVCLQRSQFFDAQRNFRTLPFPLEIPADFVRFGVL